MSISIFSNKYDVYDTKLKELMNKWIGFQTDIDDNRLLDEIEYQLARDYYKYAKTWFNVFKNADWYRDDLI